MKRIEFEIDDSTYATLTEIARLRGATVTAVIIGSAKMLASDWRIPVLKQVADLHGQNLTTGEIAGRLGMTNSQVRSRLHQLGLRPNRPAPVIHARPITPRSRKATA